MSIFHLSGKKLRKSNLFPTQLILFLQNFSCCFICIVFSWRKARNSLKLSYEVMGGATEPHSKFLIASCCIVAQSCPTLCDPMDCSMPGLPVLHYVPEFAQTHVHWINDAIQPSYPLSSPSPPAFNLSQHQGLLQWVNSSHQVAKVLELQFQNQSFQWIFRTDFLQDGLVWFPCCLRDSQESTPALQFESINSLALRLLYSIQLSHPHTIIGKTIALTIQTFVGKVMSLLFNMLFRFVIIFFQGASVF